MRRGYPGRKCSRGCFTSGPRVPALSPCFPSNVGGVGREGGGGSPTAQLSGVLLSSSGAVAIGDASLHLTWGCVGGGQHCDVRRCRGESAASLSHTVSWLVVDAGGSHPPEASDRRGSFRIKAPVLFSAFRGKKKTQTKTTAS